jgi:hypothetical protein
MRYLIALPLLALAFTACDDVKNKNGNQNSNSDETANANIQFVERPAEPKPATALDPNYKACNPYFPLVPGSIAKYTINYSNPLVADVTWVVDSSKENGREVYDVTEQTVAADVTSQKLSTMKRSYVCDNGNVAILRERGENRVDQYQNSVDIQYSREAYVMPPAADLKPGRTWSYTMTITLTMPDSPPVALDPANRILEYGGRETVDVPAGKFEAIKIVWKLREKKGFDYYARGIGLVKRVGDDGTTWQLKEYSGLKYQE